MIKPKSNHGIRWSYFNSLEGKLMSNQFVIIATKSHEHPIRWIYLRLKQRFIVETQLALLTSKYVDNAFLTYAIQKDHHKSDQIWVGGLFYSLVLVISHYKSFWKNL